MHILLEGSGMEALSRLTSQAPALRTMNWRPDENDERAGCS